MGMLYAETRELPSGGRSNDAAAPLPTDLPDFAVIDEDRHGELAICKGAHAIASGGIRFNVVFDEFDAAPFEPFAHFARMRAGG